MVSSCSGPRPTPAQERRLLTTLLQSTSDEIVCLDQDWRRLYVNPAAAQRLGRLPADLLGTRIEDPYSSDRKPELLSLLAVLPVVFRDAVEKSTEYVCTTSRHDRHYRARLIPELDESGTVSSVTVVTTEITERRHTAEDLARTAGLLEAITIGSDDMIAAQDQSFRFTFFNDAYSRECERLWGRVPELGASMIEAMAPWPEEARRARELWGRALDGESFTTTAEFGPSEDEKRIYQIRFSPVYDAGRQIVGAVHVMSNVTEMVETERALRKSEERYRLLNLSTRDVVWDLDLLTDRIEWDGMVESMFGLSRQELGRTARERTDRIHPSDRKRVLDGFQTAIDSGADSWSGEYRFLCEDGTWKVVLDRGYIARRQDGTAHRMIGTMQDITERKDSQVALARARAAAEAERDRLGAVLELLPVSVFIANVDGQIVVTNKAVESIWGLAPHSTVDSYERDYKAWWVATGNRIRSEDWAISRALSRGETSIDEEIEIETATGERRFILNSALPIRDAADRITGAVAVNVDITDLKHAEQALQQAKDEAERANRAKSEFLAHMSHEIRTPISGIIGMVELLRSNVTDPENQERLGLVCESAHALLAVVGDILDLSRIESGIVDLEIENWDARGGLHAIVAPFRVLAAEKGLTLSVTIPDNVPECFRGDGAKLAQVVRNLVSNAVKYTDHGSVSVRLLTEDPAIVPDMGDMVALRLEVEDTGIGISTDQQAAIFDSFVRVRKTVGEQNIGGTGLGLTISSRLLRLMGGTIDVASQPGRGSLFTVHIELEAAAKERSRARTSDRSELSDLRPLRILLAEDHAINQLFLTQTLKRAGHSVHAVNDGQAAINAIIGRSEEPFDVVLMDVQMPAVDGLQATAAIRAANGHIARTPIIALTAFAMKEDEHRFREAGMDGYVTKPVNFSTLAAEIRRVVTS